jgi:muconolactone delta-isomerase
MLARLKDGKIEDVKAVLEADAANHAKQGLFLEHLWRNVDDPEVLFLFRIDNPTLAKRFVRKVHAEALKQDPTINLPLMTYLEEE